MTTTTTRPAVAGRCHSCGTRTVRGDLRNGDTVEVDAQTLRPSEELRLWSAGTRTFKATWRRGIQLDPRTARDLRLNPAGYDGARIYRAHHCTTTHLKETA